jgi:hypothetical protein
MDCPFCGWGMGLAGTIDPAEIVLAFEDHVEEHVDEMVCELRNQSRWD